MPPSVKPREGGGPSPRLSPQQKYANYNAKKNMKMTLLEEILLWLGKIAMVIKVIKQKPTEEQILIVRTMMRESDLAPPE